MRALSIDTPDKRQAGESHSQRLRNASASILETQGVMVEPTHLRARDVPLGATFNDGHDRESWTAGVRLDAETPEWRS